MTTYGRLVHGNAHWGIAAQPHVLIKLKRLFPRVDQNLAGHVILVDTAEVARDLEWFIQRYPLTMDAPVAAHLRARADEHRSTEQVVRDILAGHVQPDTWRQPARRPRPYQQQAADIVHATGRLLLADDLGLGKTFSGLLVLRAPDALPALIVTPTHLTRQWMDELAISLPWLHGHVAQTSRPYEPARRRGSGGRVPDVLVVTYSKLAGWADYLVGRVNTVVFEEVHELRRGRETAKGSAAARIAATARYRVGLSATPVFNYGDEIYNIMGFLAPDALGSRAEFAREWGGGHRGLGRHLTVADPAALGTYLRDQGLMLRRGRKEVGRELPEPVRILQPVDTDHATLDEVAGDVAAMAELVLAENATPTERMTAAGEIDWRMRHATGVAKAPYVAEFVRLLLESEEQVVLCGWHRDCYDIWQERLRQFNPVLYTGTESPAAKHRNAATFMAGDSRLLIMSLRSGAGLDGLQKRASMMVFGELDWSPMMHDQCLGRLWRDGQAAAVVSYYLMSDGGTDPHMAEVLGLKRQQAEPIIRPDTPLLQTARTDNHRIRRLAADVLRRTARRRPTTDSALAAAR